ncbi:hypothetical protein bgla_1g06630 [Burkholderia gladioli BSR3]|uniref:Uncharacterized protein n=1 Tax=Burkholderia gladioli (strain BSR3) TaxID=999541 RepID=F2L980_BURGS|nr:hypothetical protein bgla_1g06630 [Burkholderia gladioli BSR3]
MRIFRSAAQLIRRKSWSSADHPRFSSHPLALSVPPGYKVSITSTTQIRTVMSAKFYFYFFWYLRPLADREE